MPKLFFQKELALLLKSYYSIIYIHSCEEERLEKILKKIIRINLNYSLYSWDFIEGYHNNPSDLKYAANNPLKALDFVSQLNKKNPAVVILKDFHLFLKDLSVQRKLKNLAHSLKTESKTIIITANEINIPLALQEIITIIDFPLPQHYEIRQELKQIFAYSEVSVDNILLDKLVRGCQGLSIERIRRVFSKIFTQYNEVTEKSLDLILIEKKQIISQTQLLEFYLNKETLNDLGGLNNLKEWLRRRSGAFSQKAKRYGLPVPKGLLLVGIQGSGKSLTAKIIANEWKLPLLRLDIGKIFGGIVGESESRMRQMIQISEAMSPCVLWIDELDKAFAGVEGKGDGGTTNRVLATFLTWLAEKQSEVFVVATANNIRLLPIEILRKGRIDDIFFLGLPNQVERKLIFQVHLEKLRPRSWFKYNLNLLSEVTENFSGAEIQQVIIEGMHLGFSKNIEFATADIIKAIQDFVPLASTYKEEIEILEEWVCSGKIRNASSE
uniref:Uncharacterized AAA domain-containing protein ycf46 n=1 Tax=Bangiopsis subsimplex TaxID=139980 RepID=A0A1C9CCN0_9RHOD|nr:hypothetical protein Bangp_030 [Bangiopsis subsimplex]AOM66112.1 hypothetical protein Bangp_030 [Bangiopsis subsimplex]ARO90331.1 conserved hypothetical plastid protein [Bangiopsis subsimplex]